MAPLIAQGSWTALEKAIAYTLKSNAAGDAGRGTKNAMAFFVFLALFLGILASFLWLRIYYSAEAAVAMAAALSLVAAAVLGLFHLVLASMQRRRISRIGQELADILHTALDIGAEEINGPVKENPKTAVILASAAGFLTGEKLH